MEDYFEAHLDLLRAGAFQEHRKDLENYPDHSYELIRNCIRNGNISAERYIECERLKSSFVFFMQELMEGCQGLLLPSTCSAAGRIGQEEIEVKGKMIRTVRLYDKYSWIANLSGFPEISVSAGKTKENMPVGISVMGNRYDEATLYQIAGQLEKALL